jgi:hypothetical protein
MPWSGSLKLQACCYKYSGLGGQERMRVVRGGRRLRSGAGFSHLSERCSVVTRFLSTSFSRPVCLSCTRYLCQASAGWRRQTASSDFQTLLAADICYVRWCKVVSKVRPGQHASKSILLLHHSYHQPKGIMQGRQHEGEFVKECSHARNAQFNVTASTAAFTGVQ